MSVIPVILWHDGRWVSLLVCAPPTRMHTHTHTHRHRHIDTDTHRHSHRHTHTRIDT